MVVKTKPTIIARASVTHATLPSPSPVSFCSPVDPRDHRSLPRLTPTPRKTTHRARRPSGTLIHYYEDDAAGVPGPPAVLSLPPSATGRLGLISIETLRLASAVRAKGSRLVLVSGTRHSTFAKRLPFLPRADAYVIENGGRIFYPRGAPPEPNATGQTPDAGSGETGSGVNQEGVSALGVENPSITGHPVDELREDLGWRERLEDVTGPASQDSLPPEQRKGPLWDLYRRAVAAGFEVDTNTYYTMLRVKEAHGPEGADAMRALLESLPPGLRVVTNLGMVDICPEASGKHNAAAYLASERFGIPLSRCASMGDDDNDIDLVSRLPPSPPHSPWA